MSAAEDMPSAGNSPIFVGIAPIPSSTGFVSVASNRYKELWMNRHYHLIMNDSHPTNGWDVGIPTEYPSSWYPQWAGSGRTQGRTEYSGLLGASQSSKVWEIPEAYENQFVDSFGSAIQTHQGVTDQPWEGLEIGSQTQWAKADYGPNFRVAPNDAGPTIVFAQPPERSLIGGYVFMGIGDVRSRQWHEACLLDEKVNPAAAVPNPFVRQNPVKIDETMTYYTGSESYGSTAYMESVNASPQDDPDLKMLAFAYGRVAYTTICTSFSQNLEHNPQDEITIKMEIIVEMASQFLVNNRVDRVLDETFGLYKRVRIVDIGNVAPYVDPVKTVVTYTFSKTDNTDDAGASVFGQRVHYSQPLELGKIVRYYKQKYDEGPIPPWTEKESYMKVLSVYPTMIYGKIIEVNGKPFYYLT